MMNLKIETQEFPVLKSSTRTKHEPKLLRKDFSVRVMFSKVCDKFVFPFSIFHFLFSIFAVSEIAFSSQYPYGQVEEGKWKEISTPLSTTVKFEIGFGYNDNIFKYSAEDIEKFINNEESDRFSNVESYDDFVTTERITVEFKKRLWKGKNTRMRFKYNRHQYAVNPIKNYQSVILNIRQGLFKKNFFQIGYLLVPQFYIRDYYDTDLKDYRRCDYQKHLIALKLGRKILRNTTAGIIYKWGYYDYNSCFNEYDTYENLFGAGISHKFSKDIGIEIEYIYKDANAKGYDEEGESVLNSDESDISCNQHSVKVDLSYDFKRQINIPLSLKIAYECDYRFYTTQKSVEDDPFHFDREDRKQTFSSGLELRATSNLSINVLYSYRKRDVYSPKKEEITEVKDYTNHKISAILGFNMRGI